MGLVIPIGKPRTDGAFEFFHTAEGAAADHTFGDQGEEAFHLIEPRTAGGGEVEIEVAVLSGFEPPLYGGALVCAVVVQNDVHVQVGRDLLLHLVEKLPELFAAMTTCLGSSNPATGTDGAFKRQRR